jgi:ATP-binding cassette, subfamily B, bacterial PglK
MLDALDSSACGESGGSAIRTRPAALNLRQGVRRLFRQLSRRRRAQLAGLIGLSVIGAIAELATIGAVFPFLALMANPALATRYSLLRSIFAILGWDPNKSIFLPATLLFIVMALAVGLVRVGLVWVVYRFTYGVGADLGKEFYRRILLQPYSYHVTRNSSETLGGLSKVQWAVSGVITPLVQSAVSMLFVLAIAVALLVANALVSIMTTLIFVTIYWLITLTTRKKLNKNSEVISRLEKERIQAVQEGLGGIRDVILDGTQGVFLNRYWGHESRQRRAQAANTFMTYAPRYVIESFGMIVMALLGFWVSLRTGDFSGALPILGALALGAQRALPQIQLIFAGWASVNANKAVLLDLVSVLELPIYEVTRVAEANKLRVEHSIELDDVSFHYSADGPEIVSSVTLRIERGGRIGFIGKTGSGKTTLADLIMGLLEPTGGEIRIDGQRLTVTNLRRWQAVIGHVPQAIYLADATIAENIAFGHDPRSIDRQRVREAAEQAEIATFVESLPEQFDTMVGERGIRLSGGQRQRIGLARAFYKRAAIIVLDEATSALDNETEGAVMNAIYASSRDVTVLIIAHRLTTLRTCDQVFELNNGRIVRECRYQDIVEPTANPAK